MVFSAAWQRYGIRPFRVAERSMSPALEPDDGLLTVALFKPRRGRLVVIEHPQREGFVLVKRVVALAGESVEINVGSVLVNGERLVEPWAHGITGDDGSWTVASGYMFVLSDARELTRADSRTFGPVTISGARRVIRVVRANRRVQG